MAESEEITVHIKSSVDKKYEFTVPLSLKVLELKEKIAAESETPATAQRLIYSGRVLKDNDTLDTYKIKSGHTIHLVKSAASRQAASNTASNPVSTSGTDSTQSTSTNNNDSSVPSNLSSGQGAFNPLAGLTGARYAGLAQLPSESMFGPDGGMVLPNEEDMERMMSTPGFQQGMNEMLRNPQMLDYLIEQSPQLRAMGPQVREMLQSDQFRQMLSNPQLMRQMRDMQRMFGGAPGAQPQAASFPAPGQQTASNNTNTTTDSTNTTIDNQAGAGSNGANPFAAMFPGGIPPVNPFAAFGGANQGGFNQFNPELLQSILGGGNGTSAQEQDTRPPEERYESQLRQLNDMGFFDFDANVQALRRSGGSVQGAVEKLLNGN
ncbi:hypothetical protein WICMUC_003211 [Wickerhamomyces mucosus]|uniref:Ubiquitin-like domain-containing protein n=1 Tax=Wickerhamomyces mucosus TaxID=1378264 RepID=A0A9P8PNN8_9ASCO|nr:hypothetical protein WICMUC_003211 [Wickerhamomyces mucosus]